MFGEECSAPGKKCCEGLDCMEGAGVGYSLCFGNGCTGLFGLCRTLTECCGGLACEYDSSRKVNACLDV